MKKKNMLLVLAIAIFLSPMAAWAARSEIKRLDFEPVDNKATLTIYFEGKGKFRVFHSEKQGNIVVQSDDMYLPARLTKLIDAASSTSPVVQVTPYSSGDAKHFASKILIQLKGKVDIASNELPGKFVLELKAKSPLISSKSTLQVKKGPKQIRAVWSETDSVKSRNSANEKGEDIAKRLVEVLNSAPEDKVYFGSRIQFEGSDVDVHDVFRLLGDASSLNIVTDPDVKYTSNFSVKDIPWDQLLDIVIQQAQLKVAVTGNVVRIITMDRYSKETEAKLREADIENENAPIVMAVIPLSFATAEDMKSMLDGLMTKRDKKVDEKFNRPASDGPSTTSSTTIGEKGVPTTTTSTTSKEKSAQAIKLAQDFVRGEIQVDSRSNSLVVTNTRPTIERLRKLVKELDVALPQVLIDAKIVLAKDTFTKNIGVSWGGRGTSGGGQSGAGGGFNTDSRIDVLGNSLAAFSVSPAAGDSTRGAFGFSIGSGRHGNLNAELQLAEANATSKTIASPRVIVNNKKTAHVVDGQSLFISSLAGANVAGTLTEVKANLDLAVTPQVTSSGSVLLDINLQKDAPVTSTTSLTAIENKQLQTQVLVDSGDTLVLGGVYQNQQDKAITGIPLLKDLPFIGQLFRKDFDSNVKNELMIFITPEIMDVSSKNAEATAL